jgi:DHA1 family bicyclomycin/chloramphenicol resistance-like MFS transporter
MENEAEENPVSWRPGRSVVAILIGLTALAPLSIDMFLPSMPRMAEQFNAAPSQIQLAVTLFIISMAVSQLLFGPVSDRFGRRRTMLVGVAVYAIAGALCGFATTVTLLLIGRIVQGFAGGSGPSVGRAVVRDVYGKEETARVLATMMTVMALAPMLAPVLGGYLQVTFGWRSVFAVLGGMGALFFVAFAIWIPETNHKRDPTALDPRRLIENTLELVSNRLYLGNVLLMTMLFCGFFAFIANSSFVLIEVLKVTPDVYGYCFGFVAFGFMSGAFISGRLVKYFERRQLIRAGTMVSATAGVLLGLQAWTGTYQVLPIIGCMYLYALGGGLLSPMATAEALIPYPEKAGLASSVMGFIRTIGGGLSGVAYLFIYDGTPNPMLYAVACSGMVGLVLHTVLLRRVSVPATV